MKVNELRIDNYILFKEWGEGDGKIGQMKRGDFGRFDKEEYHPVPLTPQWLKHFGFKRGSEIGDRNVFYSTGVHKIEIQITLNGNLLITSKRASLPIQREYVHQLQNLYFSLTGEELTITSPSA